MAQRIISNITEWNSYLSAVLVASGHHAPDVLLIIPAVAGAVMCHPELDLIEVFEREKDPKRWMWFQLKNGKKFNLLYEYSTNNVALRSGRSVIARFNNLTPIQTIQQTFNSL